MTGARQVLFARMLVALLMLGGGLVRPALGQQGSAPAADTSATSQDESADWLILPFASYAPSTKVAVGFVGGYYLSSDDGGNPSNVQVSITATQERQVVVQLQPEVYLRRGRWRVEGELTASKFPNSFYGIGGETPSDAEESYTARYVLIDGLAQRRVRSNLRVGPRIFARVDDITGANADGLIERGQVVGADGGLAAGVGVSVLWDGSDNIYYPTTGTYAEGVSTWYSAAWGSEYTFGRFKADLRGYRSIGPGVAAGQVYGEGVAGEAPFPLLPLLGGADQMRGYREGRLRDDVYWTVQTEYRLPLFWRLKGTAFVSAGEVAGRIGPALTNDIEVAVGGRLRLTDNGVHGRIDVAYSETGVELYISLGEAF